MSEIENLQKTFRAYEKRYQKAEAMGIDESSRFYEAKCEIEHRYVALYFAVEMIKSLKNKCHEAGFKKYCYEYYQLIAKEIVPYNVIINENGKKEYIAQKVKVSSKDYQVIEVYNKAKQAYSSFQEMNFDEDDKNKVCKKILENILSILNWMLIVREILFPVNRGKFDMICNM
ncbi:hypothetical protein [Anaerotignum lactatifermentans]|uniref:Uncharacterized protein n=1 Tax=Anaerotignum lactatifermentans DSM 14214 TaxID=1121323 RepID=A0A1M7BHM7_9FIRM|nr:hypothetical protein [Anaerotignum lactatifermentans]SHL54451.1 hypothetical protein SAMN02745138_03569 [[Clostridium] lactatifermentans DSM 14214] [Anaerotignum lactatifermentans DSM 14214]